MATMHRNTQLAELEESPQPPARELVEIDEWTARRASTPKRHPPPTNLHASPAAQSDSTDSSDGGVLLPIDDFDDPTQSAHQSDSTDSSDGGVLIPIDDSGELVRPAQSTFHSRTPSDVAAPSITCEEGEPEAGGIASLQRESHNGRPHRFGNEMDRVPPRAGYLEQSLAHGAGPTATRACSIIESDQTPDPRPQAVAEVSGAQLTVPAEPAFAEEVQGGKQRTSKKRRRGRRGRKQNKRRGEEGEQLQREHD
ncbi:hypothetical protein H2200_002639 [Cladophialophora chaetospira]|uniref:Uncharacterized protein n=1 Tax=Cladophialophora chaetospira TaxID=386627 RepID=A0AA38XJ99_9EURO|nr:hypothetical protein H2200_002639 [Cladophialophora chaetospira]